MKISQKIKKNLKKLLKNSNNILYNEGKNKGIFRNDNNNSAEKADSFEDEKKHKESKRKHCGFSADLTDLQQQISVVEIQSQYLKKVQNYKGDDLKKYIEKIAKDELGYVGDGERIFINVAGE